MDEDVLLEQTLTPMTPTDESFLRALAAVREVLMYSFDLELLLPPAEPNGFAVKGAQCRVFARDILGGVYATCTPCVEGRTCCIHVDPAGGASPFASNTRQTVALVVALPYWRDVLKYSSGGNLNQMRRTADHLERAILEEFPDLPLVREDLYATTPLPRLDDPVGFLHWMAVDSQLELAVSGPTGWIYQSMVGSLRIADTPGD